jgi:hypothetical protein
MKDGGPAFPVDVEFPTYRTKSEGMSLRDWFAGMALQGLMTHTVHNPDPQYVAQSFARAAYHAADAMLAEDGRVWLSGSTPVAAGQGVAKPR